MRAFYIILAAAILAGAAVAVGRIFHIMGSPMIHFIVAACVVIIFVALLRFLTRLHE